MDGPAFAVLGELRAAVDRLAQHIKHTPQGLGADGHTDGAAGGSDDHIPRQTLRRVQQDAADGAAAHVLGHFHDQLFALHLNGQGLFDPGEVVAVKDDIDHRSNDL